MTSQKDTELQQKELKAYASEQLNSLLYNLSQIWAIFNTLWMLSYLSIIYQSFSYMPDVPGIRNSKAVINCEDLENGLCPECLLPINMDFAHWSNIYIEPIFVSEKRSLDFPWQLHNCYLNFIILLWRQLKKICQAYDNDWLFQLLRTNKQKYKTRAPDQNLPFGPVEHWIPQEDGFIFSLGLSIWINFKILHPLGPCSWGRGETHKKTWSTDKVL